MTKADVSLSDRYNLEKSPVLLNGTQALVRLCLLQAARDRAAGLNTAGYVTGYRGSPLGAVDLRMGQAAKELNSTLTFSRVLEFNSFAAFRTKVICSLVKFDDTDRMLLR